MNLQKILPLSYLTSSSSKAGDVLIQGGESDIDGAGVVMRAGKSELGEGGVVLIESGFGGVSGNISMKSASSKDDRSGSLTLSTGSSESSGGTGEVLILSGDAAAGDLVAGSVKVVTCPFMAVQSGPSLQRVERSN